MCGCTDVGYSILVVTVKGELKIRPIYECRCDERLQTKDIHWVV
jgi:hypothetical protein